MRRLLICATFAVLVSSLDSAVARADIFRWDNAQLIPRTEGIDLLPDGQLQLLGWNSATQNLQYADFSIAPKLNQSTLWLCWLDNARFTGVDLSESHIRGSSLTNADLSAANLTGVDLYLSNLTGANLSGAHLTSADLSQVTLTNANLTGATVTDANFSQADRNGFTQSQLISTASYQTKDLRRIILDYNDLTGLDLRNQNLAGASLNRATLNGVDLSGAVVQGAHFEATSTKGFTQTQLASTASYLAKDLQSIDLKYDDLAGWNFASQNLAGAQLGGATLTNANLQGANLVGAWLVSAKLAGTNLTGASIQGALLNDVTSSGFTQAQFDSTESYQTKDLQGVRLAGNDLSGWNLSGLNLAGAFFYGSTLSNVDLSTANLTGATLHSVTLTNAQLVGVGVSGADFADTTSRGFTPEQLYSTASYQAKDLRGIIFDENNLGGWNLSGQNLSNASFVGVALANADLSGADLRGAQFTLYDPSGFVSRNTISPLGQIPDGLQLASGDRLVIRNDVGTPADSAAQSSLATRPPYAVSVLDHLTVGTGGVLELRLDGDPWNSVVSFQPGIPVQLGGSLELTFADNSDAVSQVGHSFHVFDWTGVQRSGAFAVDSSYVWDLSSLYTSGEVTLLAAGGTVAGDSTGDGIVDLADFGVLKDHFGEAGQRPQGDANGDGRIDLADFGLLKRSFGQTAPSMAAVPEPSTIALAAIGLALLTALPSRRRASAISLHGSS